MPALAHIMGRQLQGLPYGIRRRAQNEGAAICSTLDLERLRIERKIVRKPEDLKKQELRENQRFAEKKYTRNVA